MLVSALFAYTWYSSKPEQVGYQWIPFALVTMPWSVLTRDFTLGTIGGAIANAVILYWIGYLIGIGDGRLVGTASDDRKGS